MRKYKGSSDDRIDTRYYQFDGKPNSNGIRKVRYNYGIVSDPISESDPERVWGGDNGHGSVLNPSVPPADQETRYCMEEIGHETDAEAGGAFQRGKDDESMGQETG
jgi:hypothetical protein